MSSITKHVRKDGSIAWRLRWRTPDGRSREQWFDRKVDAEQHRTSTDHSKLAGTYVDPSAGR